MILAHERAAAGARQPVARAFGQGLGCRQVELSLITPGPLEVIAEDLVHLDAPRGTLLEPEREAFVELRASRLGQPAVRGVADQQVLKAEPVVTGQLRKVRPDQVPSYERGQARRDLWLLRRECLDRAAVKDLAFDRTAFEDPAFGRIEPVEACREQSLKRRWHGDLR